MKRGVGNVSCLLLQHNKEAGDRNENTSTSRDDTCGSNFCTIGMRIAVVFRQIFNEPPTTKRRKEENKKTRTGSHLRDRPQCVRDMSLQKQITSRPCQSPHKENVELPGLCQRLQVEKQSNSTRGSRQIENVKRVGD